MFDITNDNTI